MTITDFDSIITAMSEDDAIEARLLPRAPRIGQLRRFSPVDDEARRALALLQEIAKAELDLTFERPPVGNSPVGSNGGRRGRRAIWHELLRPVRVAAELEGQAVTARVRTYSSSASARAAAQKLHDGTTSCPPGFVFTAGRHPALPGKGAIWATYVGEDDEYADD